MISGEVLRCNVNRKGKQVGAKAVNLDIYTDNGDIKFRARESEYNKAAFSTAMNPLGTSELSDIETMISLGQIIKKAVEIN